MPYTDTMFPPEELIQLGLSTFDMIHYQLSPGELTRQTLRRKEGVLNSTGALCINTGEFTGRSPQDKFIVKDEITADAIDWNNFNQPIEEKYFHRLKSDLLDYLDAREEVWIRDAYACDHPDYRLNIRVVNENPWSNLFAYNMFLRPTEEELENFKPEWHIIQAPGFNACPATHGTRQHNFAVISFKHKTVLVGGTGYTGEMKKGVFTILNFLMPHNDNVLSMHCSANMGKDGDVAIFFGLSGTGKTTLSADPGRYLIGDDEHGWNDEGVFNFEGGCYAKCIDLSGDREPDIFNAVRPGALVENVGFYNNSPEIDFSSRIITENTRVSYPLHFIPNSIEPASGGMPQNIFYLTCDAYGVLPPISRLTPGQAMYHFISGYTARVAGTEAGVKEPKATFSACFGAPFMPLHPGKYAQMLGDKMRQHAVNVWLINTGWTGGVYGTGSRIKLCYTRAMISAALKGQLEDKNFIKHPVFGFEMPAQCPGVPAELLNPANTWPSRQAYDNQANMLAKMFISNFEKYARGVSNEIFISQPVVV
ncbi:phosphoenolpyruvate carboxykinase (ATP) [Foetidibacter luteolus]|uniref:phosphoenolpyruvate carboxykinase (ATP) n=1 Tax=Foetidibacter luteolus TaxID=2608880 RepID=UPI00129AD404|nr:phosphoenolpyruvate carboxykinase (ATP) [Foetidibacter luteolus]